MTPILPYLPMDEISWDDDLNGLRSEFERLIDTYYTSPLVKQICINLIPANYPALITLSRKIFLERSQVYASTLQETPQYQEKYTRLERIKSQIFEKNNISQERFNIQLYQDSEFNWVAYPCGGIFISDRFLNDDVSDDQIAAVICHEIAHVYFWHGKTTFLVHEINRILREYSIQEIPAKGILQKHEFEADLLAFRLLHRSGYSIDEGLLMYNKLAHVEGASPSHHPDPTLRAQMIRERIGQVLLL
jgi:Zn-dependent protease with chaperone function